MPNTLNGSPLPATASELVAGLEGKSAGRIVKKAEHASGGIVDSLGRHWNSSLHPRDARGRFIETGGVASIPALGIRGKVVRALGNGRIELRLPNGERKRVPSQQVMMVARPDGSKPIDAPDPKKNLKGFEAALKKVNDEDARRNSNDKRGNGVHHDDEGDWDGDGILNEKDPTPLGEKKPAKGQRRKGGKDVGHGYQLHSKPEGGESADVNHTLEDSEGHVVGTATSGPGGWRGQVAGRKVDAKTEDGWVLGAKRTHQQELRHGRPAAASPRQVQAARAERPKNELTPAHKEERDTLGQPGRVAYDLARHDGKNHVQAMHEGAAADRARREVGAPDAAAPKADAPNEPHRDDVLAGYEGADLDAANHARRVWDKDAKDYGQEESVKRHGPRAEYVAKQVERDRQSRRDAAVGHNTPNADAPSADAPNTDAPHAKDDKPSIHDRLADRQHDALVAKHGDTPEGRKEAAKDLRRHAATARAKDDHGAKLAADAMDRRAARAEHDNGGGHDDENHNPRTARPETDQHKAPATERPHGDPKSRDNETSSTPNPKGETSDRKPVRNDRGELLADVPAQPGGRDGGPEGVLPESRDAGAGRSGLREGAKRPESGSAGGRDLFGHGGSDAGSGEGSRGDRAGRPGVSAPGAGDRGPATGRDNAARVGDGSSAGVTPARSAAAAKKAPAGTARKFKPGSQSDLAPKGEAAKVEANLAALRTLRKIEADGDRPATPAEQKVLARWAGWGALPDVFDERKPKYAKVREELHTLMNKREWDDAKANTLNAHYTDAALVKETWGALDKLGFTGGDVLEPGSGIGNFIGMAPEGAHMTGVEVDPITAALSKKLYPDADIHHESFGDSPFRSGVFDAVVGNVPFGQFAVRDKKHNPGNRMSIHNHFITKGIDSLKPGGVMAVVTSQWTLDGPDDTHKKRIAAHADLLGAVRLPAGTHKDAAGTDVVTDLLLFRKRKDGEVPGDTSWMRTVPAVDKNGQPVMGIARKGEEPKQQQISAYFTEHPENMLGDLHSGGYNGHDLRPNGDTVSQMHERLAKITADAKGNGRGWSPQVGEKIAKRAAGEDAEGRIMFAGEVPDEKGKGVPQFTVIEDGKTVPLDVPSTQREQMRSLLELGDLTRQLLDRESHADENDPIIEDYRKRLNRAYDDYVAKHGPISQYTIAEQLDANGNPKLSKSGEPLAPRRSTPPVMSSFRRDLVTSTEVLALEKSYDPDTKTAQKSDLFEKRQVNPKRVVAQHADTPDEGVALLREQGHDLTWANLAKVLDVPESKVKHLAGDSVFEVPGDKNGKLSHRAEYLSDNVRKKLAEAQKAAETDPKFQRNVDALAAVVPPDADLTEMPLQLGADWIEPQVVTAFAQHLMKQRDGFGVKVEKDYAGNWQVKRPSSGSYGRNSSLETETWGTDRRPFYDLLSSVLKQQHRSINVYDTESDGTKVLNKEATEAAREKAMEIAAEFENWAYSDAKIAEHLSKAYSERFRALVPRSYEGSPRRAMPGMTDAITLLPHQNDAVTRAVSEPSVLFEHVVGAGKTYELAGSIMELRRLGLAHKPVLTVPNHMLNQWTSEFKELYPNAKILAADSDVLSGKDGRRRFAALARNSDWDAVVMTHTAFESIPVSEEKFRDYMGKELSLLETALLKAKADHDDKSIKQIEALKKKKAAKLEAQLEARKDDDGITFESIGFDYVAVDEAHNFKNLDFTTRMDGVTSPEGADRARDMHMKIEVVRGDDPTKHTVAFATGTPISNTLSEMYTMTRFLRPDLLEQADVSDFDSWAATFAKVEAKLETNTAGNGYVERSRMRGFTDALGDGLRVWRTFSDTKTIEDLPWIKRPKLKGGERKVHVVEQSDLNARAMRSFKDRVDSLPKGRASKGDDTHVAIIGDGRRAAIDPRLMSERGRAWSGIEADEQGDSPKIDKAASNIADLWAKTKDNHYLVRPLKTGEKDGDVAVSDTPGALQMVMIDSSAPGKGLNAYTMLKDALVARGVPADGIRFIQDYKSADQKAKLFEDARQGKVQVLMGSTAALGTGTNVQNRLYALHHLDGSWKPSDIEQREGRILRQGNQHDEVEIHVYATKGTHDIKTWDMTSYKQHVLDAMKQGDFDMRGVEFADDVDPLTDYDTIAGMASENPLVQDRREVEQALKKLQKSAGRHAQAVELANSRADRSRLMASTNRNAAAKLAEQLPKRVDTKGDAFAMTLRKSSYERTPTEYRDRKEVAQALHDALIEGFDTPFYGNGNAEEEHYVQTLGRIGGFPVRYFRKKSRFDGKPVGVLRLGAADSSEWDQTTLPTKPVEFGKADLRDNAMGIIARLENRVSSMDDQIKDFQRASEHHDQEAKESALNALRGFNGAQDLMDAQRRKALLDKMLSVKEGEKVDPADMREYDGLSKAAGERAAAEKAQRAAQLAAKKAEKADKAGAAHQKVVATDAEKQSAARDIAGEVAKARAEKRGTEAPKPEQGPVTEEVPAKPETVTVDREQVANDLFGLGTDEVPAPKVPDAAPAAPKADAPKADAPSADAPKVDAPKAEKPKGVKTPDGDGLVESVNEGQLAGQTRLGGEDMQAQITEDFMRHPEAPAPKVKPEPEAPKQDGPGLFDEPAASAPATPDATPATPDAPTVAKPGDATRNAIKESRAKKKSAMDDVVFHESYGDVSKRELRAIKKHNVSPSDHRALVEQYGEDHAAITDAITNPEHHLGDSGSFSEYQWRKGLADKPSEPTLNVGGAEFTKRDAGPGVTAFEFDPSKPKAAPAGAGDGNGGDTTPPAPSTPEPIEPNDASRAVDAVGDFDSLHGTLREGMQSRRLREMLEEDTLGAPLTPAEYRDELDKVVAETEKRLANTRRALGDTTRNMPGAARDAWQGEQDGYLHDLPVLRAARDKAAALAEGWVDPTPAETARLRTAREKFRQHLTPDEVSWSADAKGNLVGTFDGHSVEVARGKVGPNQKVHLRSIDRNGNDVSNEYWAKTGMIPNGATNKAQAEEMVKQSMTNDLDKMAGRDRARALDEARKAYDAARAAGSDAPATAEAPKADTTPDQPNVPAEVPGIPEADTTPAPVEAPAAAHVPPTGDVGNVAWEDDGNAVRLGGRAYDQRHAIAGVKVDGQRAFNLMPNPNGKGQKWTATGDGEFRRKALSELAKALGEPEPTWGDEKGLGDTLKDDLAKAGLPDADAPGKKYAPTPEQSSIIDAAKTGEDVVVRALAGTGKTSTLVEIAKEHPDKKVLYIAFNKAIAEEAARKFPKNVTVKTADAVGFQYLNDAHKSRMMKGEKNPRAIANILGVTDGITTADGGHKSAPQVAVGAMQAVEKWAKSDRDQIGVEDLPSWARGNADSEAAMLGYAKKAWADLESDNGKLFFNHAHSRKMLDRSGTQLPYNMVLFDEAQDANDALASIVRRQKAQKIVVGDSNQSIYGFTGASDQLDKWGAPHDLPLTQTWRNGEGITSWGNRFLQLLGTDARIKGNPSKVSKVGEIENPDAILTRTNAGGVAQIAQELEKGRRVAAAGDANDLKAFARGARDLMNGKRSTNPELEQFESWTDLKDYADLTDDQSLKTMIRLAEAQGPDGLVDMLDRLVPETSHPDVVVSTAHKAKGKEWGKVRIAGDFRGPKEDDSTGKTIMPSPEELRLAYVAVTRAENELDLGSLAWVEDYTDANGGKPGHVKVPAEKVREDLASLGAKVPDAPKADAPKVEPVKDVTPEADAPSLADKSDEALLDEFRAALKADPIDQGLVDRLEHELDARDAKRQADEAAAAGEKPPVESMSDTDLLDTVAQADLNEDPGTLLGAISELQNREDAGLGWGAGWTKREPATDAKPLTKKQQEEAWVRELEDHNMSVLDGIARKSTTADVDGVGGEDLLGSMNTPKPGLTEHWRRQMLQGNGVPAREAARLMPEEATMALWQKKPEELRELGMSRVGIPGSVKRRDWLDDKKRGGDGHGSADHHDNEQDRLAHADPFDLSDGELDKAIDHSAHEKDEHRREDLLREHVERDKQSEEKRAEHDQEREQERAHEHDRNRGNAHGPDDIHDVSDLNDAELNDRIKEHKDDDSDEAKKERGEKHRRDQLTEEERKKEETKRRRRRSRRRRRRRRNRHGGGGHGLHGLGLPHLPHMRMPHLPGEGHAAEGHAAEGHHPKGRHPKVHHPKGQHPKGHHSPRVPGNQHAVERELAKRDAHSNPDQHAKDLAGDIAAKRGDELTADERALRDAAIDTAYGDDAPSMDAFVAAENLPEGAVPGDGTVGGLTRDMIDAYPANAAGFDAFMRALGEPVKGQEVHDVPSLHKAVGQVNADRILEGQSVPAHAMGEALSEPDARAIFGKGKAELTALDDTPVRWVGAKSPEDTIRQHAANDAAPAAADKPESVGYKKLRAGDEFNADVLVPGAHDDRTEKRVRVVRRQPGNPNEPVYDVQVVGNEDHGVQPVRAWQIGGAEPTGSVNVLKRGPEAGQPIIDASGADTFPPVPARLEGGWGGKPNEVVPGVPAITFESLPARVIDQMHTQEGVRVARMLNGRNRSHVPELFAEDMRAGANHLRDLADGAPRKGAQLRQDADLLDHAANVAETTYKGLTPEELGQRPIKGAEHLMHDDVAHLHGFDDTPFHVHGGLKDNGTVSVASQGEMWDVHPSRLTRVDPAHMPVSTTPAYTQWYNEGSKRWKVPAKGADWLATPKDGHDTTPVNGAESVDAPKAPAAPVETATPDTAGMPELPGRGETPTDPAQGWDGRGASTLPRKPEVPETPASAEVAPKVTPEPRKEAVVRPQNAPDDLPAAVEPITGRNADWVTPDSLQIGDFARIDGHDSNGAPLEHAGYLANDPQPAEFQPVTGEPYPVLGILLSEEMDGIGDQTMVWAPLDRMAALAPRPKPEDVVTEGEQSSNAKTAVREGRMPKRIPTDSKGKLALFPRTLVTDVDGQRQGIVIASREEDVSVRWGDKRKHVEDVAGHTLTITDGGIQRPDGWSKDGHRLSDRRRGLTTPDPAKQDPIDVHNAIQQELMAVVHSDTQDLVTKIGQHLDGSKPMSKAQFERTLQGILRENMKESQARRVEAARRLVAQHPYEAGLLTKVIAALGLVALAIGAALIAALAWLFNENNRQWSKEHLGVAARAVARKAHRLPEVQKLNRLLGITDDKADGVKELVDMVGGAR